MVRREFGAMGRLLVICIVVAFVDSLEVTTYTPQAASLLHRDVLLCCEFTHSEPIALRDIGVIWKVKRGSTAHQVYKFDGLHATAERSGSSIDVTLLPMGNASLYLPNLALEDAGEYTCSVFVSTDANQASLVLKVSAQPVMSLSPMNPSLMFGESKTFLCDLAGFYPEDLEITWFKSIQDRELVLSENICTGLPVLDKNGTFRVSSQISATFSENDTGVFLICEVRHESLQRPLRSNSTVYLTARDETQGSTVATASIVACTFLSVVIFVVLYQRFLAKARPNKMYITSSPLVPRAGEKLALSCIVEKFYPKPIEMSWVKNRKALTNVTQYGPFPCDNDYYSVWNQTEFMLSEKDDGAVFICQIKHNSLGSPAEISYEINLKGMPPEVQYVSADPPVPGVGAETRLSCMIQNFFPMDIEVVWLRNGAQQDFGVYNSPCVQSSRGLYSMCAMLKFIAQAEDHESVFICRVQHVALKSCQERTYTLTLSGSSASSSSSSRS